jgi:NitT/TauT family transport system ATP-binding protein
MDRLNWEGMRVDRAKPTAVALDDVTVAFGLADAQPYIAVEQARLSVADGEFVAIVGPTGCGKSTLLNLAAGLLRPISGGVRIFDAPLAGLNRDAGYLFQADALFPGRPRSTTSPSASRFRARRARKRWNARRLG